MDMNINFGGFVGAIVGTGLAIGLSFLISDDPARILPGLIFPGLLIGTMGGNLAWAQFRGYATSPFDYGFGPLWATPIDKFVYMVLLLAVKDRASEVRFEPSLEKNELKLRYLVDGNWYDMIPVPLYEPVATAIRSHLADVSVEDAIHVREGRFRLAIDGKWVDFAASFRPLDPQVSGLEEVVVTLPQQSLPVKEAHRKLRQIRGLSAEK